MSKNYAEISSYSVFVRFAFLLVILLSDNFFPFVTAKLFLLVGMNVRISFNLNLHNVVLIRELLDFSLQDALKSGLESSIIPAFEMSCKSMFEQIDVTFQKVLIKHTTAAQQQFENSHSSLAVALQVW